MGEVKVGSELRGRNDGGHRRLGRCKEYVGFGSQPEAGVLECATWSVFPKSSVLKHSGWKLLENSLGFCSSVSRATVCSKESSVPLPPASKHSHRTPSVSWKLEDTLQEDEDDHSCPVCCEKKKDDNPCSKTGKWRLSLFFASPAVHLKIATPFLKGKHIPKLCPPSFSAVRMQFLSCLGSINHTNSVGKGFLYSECKSHPLHLTPFFTPKSSFITSSFPLEWDENVRSVLRKESYLEKSFLPMIKRILVFHWEYISHRSS